MPPRWTIIGASARAAAFSAKAAGFEPWCADLFADADLQAISHAQRIGDYPEGLKQVLASSPEAPWMYTGALENYPELIDELAHLRPLYGNRGGTLRRARDPLFWSRMLAEAGLPALRVSLSGDELPPDGTWLRKPVRSANGRDVSRWTHAAQRETAETGHDSWYFQERRAGFPISAVFVAADGQAALLGVTRQLMGSDWRRALHRVKGSPDMQHELPEEGDEPTSDENFRYAGSIGPLVLPEDCYRTIERIGSVLARECGLLGLFGIDAIVSAGTIWPVEVNPRYTASIEVLERASAKRTQSRRSHRLLSIHCHETACCFRQLPASRGQTAEAIAGKLIYYAPRDVCFSSTAARWAARQNLGHPRPLVADIPTAGTMIHHGHPVLTLLADGDGTEEVCDGLMQAADDLERCLSGE